VLRSVALAGRADANAAPLDIERDAALRLPRSGALAYDAPRIIWLFTDYVPRAFRLIQNTVRRWLASRTIASDC
jgi:hypothetical protein